MDNKIKPEDKEKPSLNNQMVDEYSKSGLYVREDDQDWGSSGINDILNQSGKI